jgi:NAD(P)-dependent dehydrogenase (short-subunit alcohol dehydrogenase family)
MGPFRRHGGVWGLVTRGWECAFDGRVVVITGAGRGLGRAYAELLADRGASVIVNDAEVQVDGTSAAGDTAGAVVEAIRANGGRAVADHSDISSSDGGAALIAASVAAFGRLDAVIHNAGILRNGSIVTMEGSRLSDVLDVHLGGAFHVIRPAWPYLVSQGYGRIVLTSSAAGVFGSLGSPNYAAAKMGLVGLALALAEEGRRSGVLTNVILPMARTRMSVNDPAALPAAVRDRLDQLDADPIAATVAWLVHEECVATGEIFATSGGRVQRIVSAITAGIDIASLTVEDVRDQFEAVRDLSSIEVATDPATALRLRLPAMSR